MLEILMALAIFSFAIIPLSLFLRTGSETVVGTRDLSGAVFVAQSTLEQCRSLPFELLLRDPAQPLPPGTETLPEAFARQPTVKVGPVEYQRTLEVQAVPGQELDARLVTVRVTWKRRKKDLAYQVWTVISSTR